MEKTDGEVTFVCSGRGAGTDVPCQFVTTSADEAFNHFEQFNHDVEEVDATAVRNA